MYRLLPFLTPDPACEMTTADVGIWTARVDVWMKPHDGPVLAYMNDLSMLYFIISLYYLDVFILWPSNGGICKPTLPEDHPNVTHVALGHQLRPSALGFSFPRKPHPGLDSQLRPFTSFPFLLSLRLCISPLVQVIPLPRYSTYSSSLFFVFSFIFYVAFPHRIQPA